MVCHRRSRNERGGKIEERAEHRELGESTRVDTTVAMLFALS